CEFLDRIAFDLNHYGVQSKACTRSMRSALAEAQIGFAKRADLSHEAAEILRGRLGRVRAWHLRWLRFDFQRFTLRCLDDQRHRRGQVGRSTPCQAVEGAAGTTVGRPLGRYGTAGLAQPRGGWQGGSHSPQPFGAGRLALLALLDLR